MPPSRIDELRRRVQNDPASIAFAQLAEEYRRSGQTDEAVRICREGLTRHPGYLSARVTLGRALLDLGQLSEARGEFEFVVAEAPENLAAVRGLAEIFHRDGVTDEALNYYRRALALARHDPEIEEIVQQLSRQVGAAASEAPGGLSYEEAHQELLSAAERVPLAVPGSNSPSAPRNTATEGATAPFDFDRLVAALGSPAAPPQVEAVVAGRPVPQIDLPEGIDLGPNPFAALEAELRAHDVVAEPVPSLDRRPVGSADAADFAGASEQVFTLDAASIDTASTAPDAGAADSFAADASADDAGGSPFAGLTAGPVVSAVDVQSDPTADAQTPRASTAPSGEGEGAATFSGLDAFIAEVAPVAAVAPVAPAAVAPPAQGQDAAPPAKEDVLGDLESWLNTLHDRSTD